MKRSLRNPRCTTGNYGKFGRLVPMHYQLIAPNETIKEIRLGARLQSLPVSTAISGATVDVWAFLVPLRLCDSAFPGFLMNDGSALATDDLDQDWFFEAGTMNGKPSHRRKAYELIVNEYFRSSDDTAYTWNDAPAVLPLVDQTAEFYEQGNSDTMDETVDVTAGTPDTVSLREIDRAQDLLRYREIEEQMDGHYSEYLKRCGVGLNEKALGKPELIAANRKFIMPSRSMDPATGLTTQAYMHDMRLRFTRPRYSLEHSWLMTFISVRPKVLIKTNGSLEGYLTDREEFPHPWQMRENNQINTPGTSGASGTSDNGDEFLDDVLFKGQALSGKQLTTGTDYRLVYNPTTQEELRFPTTAWDSVCSDATTFEGDDFGFDGYVGSKIVTPLKGRFQQGTALPVKF